MTHVELAPAKINLSLRVLQRRQDGFHDVETLMVALRGPEDVIRFDLAEGRGGIRLICDDPLLPVGGDNLIMRAIQVFSSRTGREFTGEISLEKRIPSGAGLGGGSSDAAATLRSMNTISGGGFSDADLCVMAAEIGADVAFFVNARPSVCTGRGEKVTLFPGRIPVREVLLLKPCFSVSTAWAYSQWEGSMELPGMNCSSQSSPWGELCNDLERPVFAKHLVLAAMKSWLLDQAETEFALMSGSGSTLFAILKDGCSTEILRERALMEFGESCWGACASMEGKSSES